MIDREAAIVEDFGNGMDMSHAGRPGNTATLNGRIPEDIAVAAEERLRLRLVDVANAGIFALRFEGDDPVVVARDGHRVTPLAPNPVPEPDLAGAVRREIVFEGGMMGGMRGGREAMRSMMMRGVAWAVNGVADDGGHALEPFLTVPSGRSVVLDLVNETAWWHPIHLHGHAFRILTRDGAPEPHAPLADTALMAPRERMEIAFVAEGPGDWLLHCHVLEHQAGGMSAILRVV